MKLLKASGDGAVPCCGCALAIPVNTSCASFRCENSNSVVILPGAYSPAELTATAHGDRGHDDAPSSWLVFVQSAGTLHWLGRPSPNRGTIYRSLLMTSQDFQAELASVLNRRFEMSHTKDIDFSALGISACREAGYAATWNALERANWRGKFDRLKA